MTDLKTSLFQFLTTTYVQHADDRQKARGLQYTEAETHDLAAEIAKFINAKRPDGQQSVIKNDPPQP